MNYIYSFLKKKMYIKTIQKANNTSKYKVILKKFTILDKIDTIGPNITIKNIVDNFRNKYNRDTDFINYDNQILASPMEDDDNMNDTIKKLIQDKTVKKQIIE